MAEVPSRLYEVSRRLPDRKETSSYYTTPDGVRAIRQLLTKLGPPIASVVADPFAGSGVLIVGLSGLIMPSKVIGFEVNEAPCRLAEEASRSAFPTAEVEVRCGDAFRLGWGYGEAVDLVVTNPPFTRWHLVRGREELLRRFEEEGYGHLITRRDPGLHVLGLILAHHMLRDGGLLVAVVPASTFYTRQGEGVKDLLTSAYDVLALVENGLSPSFSDGSGFKELIMVARKGRRGAGTMTYRLTSEGLKAIGGYDLSSLPRLAYRNWLTLFDDTGFAVEFSRRLEEGLRRGEMRLLRKGEVVRGVEMYGPEFFFLPNRTWRVVKKGEEGLVITDGDRELLVPAEMAVPCLRRPSLYVNSPVIENPEHYALSIPPVEIDELPGDVRAYVNWGVHSGAATPAVRAFGPRWYSHVRRQLESKSPFGHVFLPDKVAPSWRHLALYSPRPLCATKDFYVIRTDDPRLAQWFNSEEFRRFYMVASRAISGSWTRMLEEDYLSIPVPR